MICSPKSPPRSFGASHSASISHMLVMSAFVSGLSMIAFFGFQPRCSCSSSWCLWKLGGFFFFFFDTNPGSSIAERRKKMWVCKFGSTQTPVIPRIHLNHVWSDAPLAIRKGCFRELQLNFWLSSRTMSFGFRANFYQEEKVFCFEGRL